MDRNREEIIFLLLTTICFSRSGCDSQDSDGTIARVDDHVPAGPVKGDLLDKRCSYLLFPDDPSRSGIVDSERAVPRPCVDSISTWIKRRKREIRAVIDRISRTISVVQ